MNSGRIHHGVSVGNVALGGKTPDQARAILKERAPGALEEIRFTGPKSFSLTGKQLGLNFDVAGSVDRAYSVGRQGNVLKRLGDRLRADLGAVEVPPVVSYRKDVARSALDRLARKLDTKPESASLSMHGSNVQVGNSKNGYKLNVPATMKNVDAAVSGMNGRVRIVGEVLKPNVSTEAAQAAAGKVRRALSGTVTLSYKAGERRWTLSPQDVNRALSFTRKGHDLQVSLDGSTVHSELSDMYGALEKQPVDARFVFKGDKPSVQKGRTGTRIDDSRLLAALQSGIFKGKREYEVPVVTAQPQVTTAKAEQIKPDKLLGKYRTKYIGTGDSSQARIDNLKIASKAITGTVLAPGQTFSFDKIAAPLNYEKAHVFGEGGQVDDAYGGGLCQVASTLYMATNWAGMKAVERHPHYAELNYIRPGFDATVWFGTDGGHQLDFKFKNTSPGYIVLREHVADDGYIYADVYGQKSTGLKVEMYSKPSYMSTDGSTWVTYKKVTDEKTGKVLFDGVLHTDSYQPVTLNGKTYTPEDIPAAPVRP